MADPKEELIKIAVQEKADVSREPQPTLPVEEHRRLKDEEIIVQICSIDDMPTIAEQLYICLPDKFWDTMEPCSRRDGDDSARVRRLAMRLSASFHLEHMRWVKAVYVPTGRIVGIAGWMLPGMPVHNVWRRTAIEFYGFDKIMGWSQDDIEEMWKGIDLEAWEKRIGGNDEIRAQVMGGEEHWFLAPLMTLPEWRGRGVASRLMKWAIEQADKADPVQPMYLESAPTARNMYLRFGFKPIGEANFLRRGPVTVEGDARAEKVDVKAVEREVDGGVVS